MDPVIQGPYRSVHKWMLEMRKQPNLEALLAKAWLRPKLKSMLKGQELELGGRSNNCSAAGAQDKWMAS